LGPGSWALGQAPPTPAETGDEISLAVPLYAADDLEAAAMPAVAAPEAAPPKRISADAGLTFTTAYLSHGIVQDNQGVIAQPYGDLYFTLYDGKSGLQKVTLFGGIWNSLHSNHEFATTGTLTSWYEFDWNAGVSFDFLDRWNLAASYVEYTSPSNSFATSKNVQLRLAYNDADSKISLMPYATLFVETNNKAGSGTREGYSLELGINPSIPLTNAKSDYPVKLTFPTAVALGFHDFFGNRGGDDELFGYATTGAVASIPLAFMSKAGYGDWTLSAGAYLYYFGPGTRWINDVGAYTDEPWLAVGSVTLGVAF
jgi:hypothetical protein